MKDLAGNLAPVPTPLSKAGAVRPRDFGPHLQWLAGQGLHGALILGTNGEFASFSMRERGMLARGAAEARPRNFRLLLNVGACALPEVLQFAKLAHECRYAAILVPPPWYFRAAPTAGLADFFRRVLDASRLPVLLYHIPQVTGVSISNELLDAIGAHDNLGGIKDSTGDPAEVARLVPRFAAGSYLVGNDKLVADCIRAGGKGSITACASVVPDLVVAAGRDPAQQAKLNSVRAILERYGLMPSVKAILGRAGMGDYATRPPLKPLDRASQSALFAMLDALGVLALPVAKAP